MAREPQLANVNRKLIEGSIDSLSYFREIGPFLGLTLILMDSEAFLFSDPVSYEVFKASDTWLKDLTKKGMPLVLTGQTGLQIVAALAKLAASTDTFFHKELRISIDVTHTTGLHISGLKSEVFINLQQCLDLEKALLAEKSAHELAQAVAQHNHLHLPSINRSGEEVLAFFKINSGEQVVPIFSASDLAFGALGSSNLGLFEVKGSSFFQLLEKYPDIRTQTIGLLFNPYSNTERLVPWSAIEPAYRVGSQLGQSA